MLFLVMLMVLSTSDTPVAKRARLAPVFTVSVLPIVVNSVCSECVLLSLLLSLLSSPLASATSSSKKWVCNADLFFLEVLVALLLAKHTVVVDGRTELGVAGVLCTDTGPPPAISWSSEVAEKSEKIVDDECAPRKLQDLVANRGAKVWYALSAKPKLARLSLWTR